MRSPNRWRKVNGWSSASDCKRAAILQLGESSANPLTIFFDILASQFIF